MAREVRERLCRGPEPLDLQPRERVVAIGRSEVTHEADDVASRRRELREPPAAHAGVELQMNRHAVRSVARDGDELQPRLACLLDLLRGRGAEDKDAGL